MNGTIAEARPYRDLSGLRSDFPILDQTVNGKPLVYLDNAATTQKPRQVVEAMRHYYERENSNVHRGAHHLSELATESFEAGRRRVAEFINAESAAQVIWTRGTTEAINLVAQSYGRSFLSAGDRILVSELEHHSNIVPWQQLAEQTGAIIRVIPVSDAGEIDQDAFDRLVQEGASLLAINHVSNALGTINPVREMCRKAREEGIVTVVDGAQAVPHLSIDVQSIGCDFYAFSGHKVFGPTGIGALYGRRELLEKMPPWQGGGEMIERVSFEGTTYNIIPFKFEAGTPAIAEVSGLHAALDYLDAFEASALEAHEQRLLTQATDAVRDIQGLRIIGTAAEKVPVLSFIVDGTHPADLGTLMDHQGVAVRTGHHCTQPLMQRFGIPGTVRASFALYNLEEEIPVFLDALHKSIRMCRD